MFSRVAIYLMKHAVLLFFLFSFASCSGSGSNTTSNATAAPAAAPAVAVDSSQIQTRELQRTVEAIGTLEPNEEVTVSNQVEGLVSQILVDLGDSVRKGQVV